MLISGALLALAERFQKRATTSDSYIDHTVTAGDLSSRGYRKRDDQEVISRVRQHVLTCGMFNAQSCAMHPMRLYRRKGAPGSKAWNNARPLSKTQLKRYNATPWTKAIDYAADGEFEEVMDSPMQQLLRRANSTRKGTTWFIDCWAQWWYFGKRFIHHVDAGPKGAPSMLWLMRAQDTGIIPAREDGLIAGYRYGRSGETKEYMADEVMYQIFRPSPFNPYDAIAPIHSLFIESDIYLASTISAKAMWENGVRFDAMLSFKGDKTAEQIKQAQAQIDRDGRGPSKKGRILATTDATLVPLNFSPREMEDLKTREDLKGDIYNAFGIPESIRKLNNSNRASAEAGMEQYARWTLFPAMTQDAEEWTESYLPLWGIDPGEYWFAYDNPIPEDRESLRQDVATFVKKPVWTVDEARAEMGYDPSPELNAEPEEPKPPTPDPMDDMEDAEDDDQPEAKRAHVCGPACGHGTKEATIEAPQEAQSDLTEAEKPIAQDMVRTLLPWFLLLAATMTVRRISTGTNVDAPEDESVTVGDFVATLSPTVLRGFSERVRPVILRAMLLGAEKGLDLLPAPSGSGTTPVAPIVGAPAAPPTRFTLEAAFDVVNNWAPKHLDDYTILLKNQVSKTTLDQIKMTIREGIAAGSSQQQIVQTLQNELTDMAPARAKLIAVTETRRAYEYGNLLLWKEAGAVRKRIVLADNPCPVCIAIADLYNAEGLDIDEPFWAKGEPLDIGDGLMVTNTYQDADAPPFHPNCFCLLEPVFEPLGGGE